MSEDGKPIIGAAFRLREDSLAAKSATAWEAELNALGIPSGAVLSVQEVLESEQLAARDFLEDFAAGTTLDRDIQVVSTGVKIDGARPKVDTPPPALGADAAEIWGELGLSEDDLADLHKKGVI